jgi:phosphoribosyl 1,2-cyclic phosphodiesterase
VRPGSINYIVAEARWHACLNVGAGWSACCDTHHKIDDYQIVRSAIVATLHRITHKIKNKTKAAACTMAGQNTKSELSVTFWGVRGSIACPGAATVRYGGNTSCVEVRALDRLIVLDAGTGLLALGARLMSEGKAIGIDILLTHFHLDHVCGLPFFAPFFAAGHDIRIWAAAPAAKLSEIVHTFVSPPLFPVGPTSFKAAVSYHGFAPGDSFTIGGGVRLRTAALNHPDGAVGYRIEAGSAALAYLTDTEIGPDPIGESMVALANAADLLIVDCTYTEAEIVSRRGWGHATWADAVRLANAAGAKTLCPFHHDPGHDDATMDIIGALAQAARPGSIVAREGMTINL